MWKYFWLYVITTGIISWLLSANETLCGLFMLIASVPAAILFAVALANTKIRGSGFRCK